MSDQILAYDASGNELLKRELLHESFFSFERFTYRHKRFDGTWSREVVRDVFIRGSATCVLPYDPVRDEVLLIEQIRPGAMLREAQTSPWLLELVAGINDKDESPEELAKREAEEEAGIQLYEIEKICDYFPSPGACTEWVYLRCARANLEGAGGIYGLPEEDEDIKVHVLPFEQAYRLIERGDLVNAPVIMALQWLMLNRERLSAQWT